MSLRLQCNWGRRTDCHIVWADSGHNFRERRTWRRRHPCFLTQPHSGRRRSSSNPQGWLHSYYLTTHRRYLMSKFRLQCPLLCSCPRLQPRCCSLRRLSLVSKFQKGACCESNGSSCGSDSFVEVDAFASRLLEPKHTLNSTNVRRYRCCCKLRGHVPPLQQLL